jgi:hypothetical protein
MEYSKEFRELLEIAEKFNQTYVGHGNPNAKILIIANEPAADKNTDFGRDLIKYDLDGNLEHWNTNLNIDKLDQDSLEEWFDDAHYGDWNKFNPLWPFKGQRYCQLRFKKGSDKEFNFSKRPTSRTWKQYQKLLDMIYHPEHECNRKQNDTLDFFKHAFVMDFSSEYGKTSKDIDSKLREDSISARLPLFKSAFISHFPVIIVAAGHYIDNIEILNDLREVFSGFEDVEVQKKIDEPGWRNIHKSQDGKRILIHTKHFASSVKDPYLKEIAKLCSPFII